MKIDSPFLKDRVIDGRGIAKKIRQELKHWLLIEHAVRGPLWPTVVFIRVGDDPASKSYVRAKERAAKEVGIHSQQKHLPEDISEKALLEVIEELNTDGNVDGILVQLPLPDHIGLHVLNHINPLKDVDGFHPENLGALLAGDGRIIPCTALGILTMLQELGCDPKGKHVAVVGRGLTSGRPTSSVLLRAGATVTSCHRHTANLEKHTSRADILVTATGVPGLIQAQHVKEGALVFDVGITRTKNGLVGDVAFEEVVEKAQGTTPVPGGVGPMTVACLLQNVLRAAKLHYRQLPSEISRR